jgi:hypothetical protein
MTLFDDLKTQLSNKGVTVTATNVFDLANQILDIKTKSKNTSHTVYDLEDLVPDDGSNVWIHEDTTRKLNNLKRRLTNNLLTQNVEVDYDSKNIPNLIEMVSSIIIPTNTTTNVSVASTTLTTGDSTTISCTLKDSNNNTLTGSEYPIIISIDGTVDNTINAGASYSKTFSSSGKHTITATYSTSNLSYNNSVATTTIQVNDPEIVKSDSTSSINIQSLSSSYVGATIVLTGSNSAGGTVKYYEGSTFKGTSSSGGTLSISGLTEGTHYYHSYFSGSTYYNASTSEDISVTISKAPSDLSISSTGGTVYINETSVTVSATGTGTVNIKNSGGTVVGTGYGSASYTFTPSAYQTSFTVTNTGSGSVSAGSVNYTVTASDKSTTPSLGLSISSKSLTTVQSTTINVTGVSGPTLSLVINGTVVTTSTSGSISYTFSNSSTGSYSVYATSSQTGNYNSTQTGTQTITVSKDTPIFSKGNGTSSTYYSWYVYIKLLNSNSGGISGQNVSVTYVDSTNGSSATKTCEDMGGGNYRFQHYCGDGGSGTVRVTNVSFGGNSMYNSCSTSFTIPLNSLPTKTSTFPLYSLSTEGSGGNYSTWNNFVANTSTSNYANCHVTYTHNYGGTTDLPPTLVIIYASNLPSNTYKIVNVNTSVQTRLLNKSSSSSPSMSNPNIKVWANGTLVIDTGLNSFNLGSWVSSNLSNACSLGSGRLVIRIYFSNNTGYGSGEVDLGAVTNTVTYSYIPSQ